MVKALISTCLLTALVCATGTDAAAATSDKRTYFSFNQPFSLPGVTLPAGTYTFRQLSFETPSVVQVTDRAGMHSYAMLMAIPALRAEATDKPEIEFMETGRGVPNAVRGWWYPGNTRGWQFIYSKDQLRRLSEGVAPVPTGVAEASAAPAVIAEVTTTEPAAEASEARALPPPEVIEEAQAQPAPAAQQPQASVSQEPAPAPAPRDARTELPHTASPIWLMLALGSLMASSGFVLVRGARRS